MKNKIKENKIAIITLANHGFLNFTNNCIKSLEKLGLGDVMTVYCIDDKCYTELSSSYGNCCLIESEYNKKIDGLKMYPRSDDITESLYKDVVFMKFPAILNALEKNDYVLFLDADVVFQDNRFVDYLLKTIKDNDVLFQTEASDDESDVDGPCSGIMFIRSNDKTLDFYNPSTVLNDKHYIDNVGDQDYVRGNKDKLKHDYMDVKLFPNGRYMFSDTGSVSRRFNYYKRNRASVSPYMIHYNWCRPKFKVKLMKRTGDWFL
jgi:hypothetical protein